MSSEPLRPAPSCELCPQYSKVTPEQIQDLRDTGKMVREMHTVVVGNPAMRQVGLLERMDNAELKQRKTDTRFTRWAGVIAGIGLSWEIFKVLYLKNG